MDLVYYEELLDFCEWNFEIGFFGIKGCFCNNIFIGMDGCDLMCCDRGFIMSESEMEEFCNCCFFWCCKVKC